MDLIKEVITNDSIDSKNELLEKLNQEIELIEEKISQRLNLKYEKKFRYLIHDLTYFLAHLNQNLNQADNVIENFEINTCCKIKKVKKCLIQKKKSIISSPSSNDDTKQLNDVDNPTQNLEPTLTKDSLILSLSQELSQNQKKYDDISREYIIKARKLIDLSLFPFIEVGSDLVNEFYCQSINQSLFDFPKCKISESTFNLIQLLQDILEHASKKSTNEQKSLIDTARDICELYLITVLIKNKDSIWNLHQSSALFHNNCMYIAHQLLILPFDYQFNEDNLIVTFIDYVFVFRDAAYDHITEQLKRQKDILNEYIHDPLVVQCLSDNADDNFFNRSLLPLEKALKRSLTHLMKLKGSWIEILPQSVCNKLIATLLNQMIAEIVSQILSLEDIPSDVASSIFRILQATTSDIEKLMNEFLLPYDKVLPKWQQFQELKIILQASLRDIIDRWDNGNGPLSVAFTAEEVKHFIRSLFQNTNLRSSALAKIK